MASSTSADLVTGIRVSLRRRFASWSSARSSSSGILTVIFSRAITRSLMHCVALRNVRLHTGDMVTALLLSLLSLIDPLSDPIPETTPTETTETEEKTEPATDWAAHFAAKNPKQERPRVEPLSDTARAEAEAAREYREQVRQYNARAEDWLRRDRALQAGLAVSAVIHGLASITAVAMLVRYKQDAGECVQQGEAFAVTQGGPCTTAARYPVLGTAMAGIAGATFPVVVGLSIGSTVHHLNPPREPRKRIAWGGGLSLRF